MWDNPATPASRLHRDNYADSLSPSIRPPLGPGTPKYLADEVATEGGKHFGERRK